MSTAATNYLPILIIVGCTDGLWVTPTQAKHVPTKQLATKRKPRDKTQWEAAPGAKTKLTQQLLDPEGTRTVKPKQP